MIKLTNKTRYGVRALMEIGIHYGLRPTKKKEIVASTGASAGYLENILVGLRNAGIVDATRGAQGGFVLRRHPQQLTMFEVVRALQGDSETVIEGECEPCVSDQLWREVYEAQRAVLQSKTLADIIALKQASQSMGFGI